MCTKLNLSIAFHPPIRGKLERMIQILEDLLRSYNLEFGCQWEDHLPYVEFAYNNGHQAMISMAPYKALYGKNMSNSFMVGCGW